MSLAFLVDPSEGVGGVAMHVPESVGSSSITHQDGDLVGALRDEPPEVPSSSWVLQVRPRVFLLGVDEVGKLRGISDEENRSVVAGHVPVTLLSIELNCKA